MSNGWISLHRSLLDWEWYTDANTMRLFIHLLLIANHSDKKYKSKIIKRGELITGREKLSAEIGLSVQAIRTSLKRLKSTNEITIESTSKGTLINIVNYSHFQGESRDSNQHNNQQANQPTTNQQPTNNQQVTTNNNVNNNNNNNNVNNKPNKSAKPTIKQLVESFKISEDAKKTLNNWIDYKKQRKDKAYTEIGLKTLANKIDKYITDYGINRVNEVVTDTIASNYQGIVWDWFTKQNNQGGNYGQNNSKTSDFADSEKFKNAFPTS